MKLTAPMVLLAFAVLAIVANMCVPEPKIAPQPSIEKHEFTQPGKGQPPAQAKPAGGGIVMPTPTPYVIPPGGFDAANAGKTCVPTGLYWHAGGCVASTSCGQYESRPREVCQAAGLVW